MTDARRRETLEAIADEIRTCTACRLHRGRTRAVPGEGSSETEVVFVGEGPGANEDQQGRPFVGAAGGLLTELIGSIGWKRDEVFITNIVKCRPPGNRDPEPDEIAACSGYLHRQLEALDPALIVTLGRFSLQTFMPGARISSAHGTIRPVDPATGAAEALAMALYHPAAAFRQAALKETLSEDIAGAPEALIRARQRRDEHRFLPGEMAPDRSVATEPPKGDGERGTANDPPLPLEAQPDSTLDAPSLIDAELAATDLAPEAALVAADDPNQMRFF